VPISRVGDEYVALEPVTGMYGEGDTAEEALADLLGTLATVWRDLRMQRDRLAPDLRADLEFLDRTLWS
jgi:hypothetical protein